MSWLNEVQGGVEARLEELFDADRARLSTLGEEANELVESIAALTMRGGKRLRPAVLYAAFRAVRPEGTLTDVVDAGAALELLQSYLLIHDDWMDGDAERRGGPSVHAALGDKHGDARLGASLAILAGNLACAWSWRIFYETPAATRDRVLAVVSRMHEEVLVGQELDLLAVKDVSRMHQLKTGSYTLRGPMALGAALARASEAQEAALMAFATPLGEAFQMRDDLLGSFGDPGQTGKPAGNDLREGKRTSLVAAAEARLDAAALAPLHRVLGRADATPDEVDAAIAVLTSSGARADVEARLEALLAQADAALTGAPLEEPGTTMLRELAAKLAYRST